MISYSNLYLCCCLRALLRASTAPVGGSHSSPAPTPPPHPTTTTTASSAAAPAAGIMARAALLGLCAACLPLGICCATTLSIQGCLQCTNVDHEDCAELLGATGVAAQQKWCKAGWGVGVEVDSCGTGLVTEAVASLVSKKLESETGGDGQKAVHLVSKLAYQNEAGSWLPAVFADSAKCFVDAATDTVYAIVDDVKTAIVDRVFAGIREWFNEKIAPLRKSFARGRIALQKKLSELLTTTLNSAKLVVSLPKELSDMFQSAESWIRDLKRRARAKVEELGLDEALEAAGQLGKKLKDFLRDSTGDDGSSSESSLLQSTESRVDESARDGEPVCEEAGKKGMFLVMDITGIVFCIGARGLATAKFADGFAVPVFHGISMRVQLHGKQSDAPRRIVASLGPAVPMLPGTTFQPAADISVPFGEADEVENYLKKQLQEWQEWSVDKSECREQKKTKCGQIAPGGDCTSRPYCQLGEAQKMKFLTMVVDREKQKQNEDESTEKSEQQATGALEKSSSPKKSRRERDELRKRRGGSKVAHRNDMRPKWVEREISSCIFDPNGFDQWWEATKAEPVPEGSACPEKQAAI